MSAKKDIRKLLLAGADKVSINTAAAHRPEFVGEAAEKFESQCIVVAIDAGLPGPTNGKSLLMADADPQELTRLIGQ